MAERHVSAQGDKTVLKGLGQCSFTRNGDPAAVDVKDGKILRIRPLHFEDKYTKEEIKPWRIEKDGKVLEPNLKSHLAPYMLAYKKRVYSPNRILYPLMREDWDPTGAPGSTGAGGRNEQNRGKSKYSRISWDEATDLIASRDHAGASHLRAVCRSLSRRRPWRDQDGAWPALLPDAPHGESRRLHSSHPQRG